MAKKYDISVFCFETDYVKDEYNVPILMANISKIKGRGFEVKRNLDDIINSQVNYYLDPVNRKNVL